MNEEKKAKLKELGEKFRKAKEEFEKAQEEYVLFLLENEISETPIKD